MTENENSNAVAIVTGGASGIGEAIVAALVSDRVPVVVGDADQTNLDKLAARYGDAVLCVLCDVRQEHQVSALVERASEIGLLTMAFNVAGVGAPMVPFEEHTSDQWDFVVDICLKGVFLSMKHEARAMLRAGVPGSIVNFASVNAVMPMFGGVAYVAAKAGVVMLSQSGALEWGDRGIRVNTVSPGVTLTPMNRGIDRVPGLRDAYLDRIPIKRMAVPSEMADAALFLASPKAGYVSGINLQVDGGWGTTSYPDMREPSRVLRSSPISPPASKRTT